MAAVSSVALKITIQTKHFVEDWHKDSHELWIGQTKIDTRLQNQVDVLKQTVEWLGQTMVAIEKYEDSRCDWNSTTFCVTEYMYNDTYHDWKLIQAYLEGNDIATKIINALKYDIWTSFGKQLQDTTPEEIAKLLADELTGLDPKAWSQNIFHSMGKATFAIIVCALCIMLLYFTWLNPYKGI